MSKYRSSKVGIYDMEFDSKKEYFRYLELVNMQQDGIITDLQRQVVYTLIPKQKLDTPRSSRSGRAVRTEQAVTYSADFVYKIAATGEEVVEDVKSPVTRTKDYIIKRKLMKFIHNIEIQEV